MKQIIFISMLLSATTSFAAHFAFLNPSILAKTNAVVCEYMARIDTEITSKRDEYKNILTATVNKKLPSELTENENKFITTYNIDLSRPIESIWYIDVVWDAMTGEKIYDNVVSVNYASNDVRREDLRLALVEPSLNYRTQAHIYGVCVGLTFSINRSRLGRFHLIPRNHYPTSRMCLQCLFSPLKA